MVYSERGSTPLSEYVLVAKRQTNVYVYTAYLSDCLLLGIGCWSFTSESHVIYVDDRYVGFAAKHRSNEIENHAHAARKAATE